MARFLAYKCRHRGRQEFSIDTGVTCCRECHPLQIRSCHQPLCVHRLFYALKACRLFRCPPNPGPKSKDRRLLHLLSALFLHRTKCCPVAPTPTNRGCQTVPHPPATVLHRRFSHKEYYQNSAV